MFSRTFKKSPLALICLFAAAMTLVIAFPATAHAKDVMAYSLASDGTRTDYYTTDDAIQAGYAGKVIYLNVDWNFTGTMIVEDSQSLTINMNGHWISGGRADTTIHMRENSNLTLTADESARREFVYDAYFDPTTSTRWTRSTTTTGGMVTHGSSGSCGGICMDANSTLTLDNVTVGGNFGGAYGGGLACKKNCTINMRNRASVEGNAGFTGGVYLDGEYSTLNLDNAYIQGNCGKHGGGAGIKANHCSIFLENSSNIGGNSANSGGGGVFIDYTYFTVESKDGTGTISGNNANGSTEGANGGGGIYVAPKLLGSNEGIIKGLTISGNYTGRWGGGVYVDHEYVTISDCKITNNRSCKEGGGVYVDNDNCSIGDCSITDNICNYERASYEGGGVFVSIDCNRLTLFGTCVIKDNTRRENGQGQRNNLYLSSSVGGGITTYLEGSVLEGSCIGITTSSSGDRRIAKNVASYVEGSYFMDPDGFFITHGTDEGGDIWQRAGEEKHVAKLNGEGTNTYKWGTTISANGASTDEDKVFWHWDKESTKGLYPINSFITDENYYSPAMSYSMPQCDTDLIAVYADRVASATAVVTAPVAGEELATTASFCRTDGGTGAEDAQSVALTWYEVADDGSRSVATGTAEYGKSYVAAFAVEQQQEAGLFFSSNITTANVTVCASEDARGTTAAHVAVDDAGSLSVETAAYKTAAPEIDSVTPASLTVTAGTPADAFVASLPTSATVTLKSGDALTLATDKTNALELIASLLNSDGNVAELPEGSEDAVISLPLASSSEVKTTEGYELEVTVTVLASEEVAAPTLFPAGGTYDKYNSSVKLDDSLELTVSAICSTSGATIKYTVDDGNEQTYDDAGITLTGAADATVVHTVKAWAERTVSGKVVSSEPVFANYTLDDTLRKSVTLGCTDTALYNDEDERWSASFTVSGNLNEPVAITAPAQDGRVFGYWLVDGKKVEGSTLTVESFSLDLANQVEAVYIPVVTKIDLGISVPDAHEALAANANYVKVGVGDGEPTTLITSYFADDAAVAWSPEAEEDGSAAHLTGYTASLKLGTISSDDGVQYALADNLQLYVNGATSEDFDGSAYIATDAEGNKSLCATFPETEGYKYASLESPADVSLTFDEANAYQKSQESGEVASWGLPSQVKVTYACGDTELLDVMWSSVSGFDAESTGAQELEVEGTVTYPDYVDGTDAPTSVTAKIKVAAPEDDSGDDSDDDSDDDSGEDEDDGPADDKGGNAPSGKEDSNDALAQTGDIACAALPIAGVGAVAALAGAMAARRRSL